MNYKKRYVELRADFDVDGQIRPLCIVWEDGTEFQIDRADSGQGAVCLAGGKQMICGGEKMTKMRHMSSFQEIRMLNNSKENKYANLQKYAISPLRAIL